MTELDIDHLRDWIGREQVSEDVLGEDLARKYHATLEMPGEAPRLGEVAPRMIHFCLAQPVVPTSALGPDGHPRRGGFLPPVALPRRMWAGGLITFPGDLRVGDRVERRSRIADVELKRGRTGPLCFVTAEHRILVDEQIRLEERQDIVYRDLDAVGGKAAPAAESGAYRRRVEGSAPLLFRYSALTFNGHRIHYDRRYVTEVEGYPGLIVHGPLQAAWLFNHAAEVKGAPPSRFAFRGLSPLFDDDAIVLDAAVDGEGLRLWSAREGGPVAMSAEASWA
jgi:3-methylfumaryl-CoA hydratase